MGKAKSRKIKTPQQLQAEAEQKMRDTLTGAGVPEFRVEGAKVHDFAVAAFSDIKRHEKERRSYLKVAYPTLVDRWLAEGGTGFDEPQKRAVDHCRSLWALLGTQRLVANYTGVGGGGADREGEVFARAQLAEYKSDIPRAYWEVFENVVRFDMPAGTAGSHLANNPAQQQAHAKNCVGFVASLIAQWRGY